MKITISGGCAWAIISHRIIVSNSFFHRNPEQYRSSSFFCRRERRRSRRRRHRRRRRRRFPPSLFIIVFYVLFFRFFVSVFFISFFFSVSRIHNIIIVLCRPAFVARSWIGGHALPYAPSVSHPKRVGELLSLFHLRGSAHVVSIFPFVIYKILLLFGLVRLGSVRLLACLRSFALL